MTTGRRSQKRNAPHPRARLIGLVAMAISLAASFVPNVSDVASPVLEPARRKVVEREEG